MKRGRPRIWGTVFLLSMAIGIILSGCGARGVTMPTATPTLLPTAVPTATATVAPTPTLDIEKLAARVNGEPIPLADYERQVRQFKAAYADANYDWTSEEGQRLASQIQSQVLEAMIQTLLIQQEAARRGLTVSDEELEANVQESIEKGDGEAAFKEWLQKNGLTREQFVEEVRTGLLTSRLIEELTADLKQRTEQVHARHILLADLTTAQQVRRMLDRGEDFATLAKEYSHDQFTRDNGGDLGWFARGTLTWPEVEEAAFALQPGQISDVVKSPMGYHIIQVIERDPDRPLSPEMFQALKERTVARWLEEQRRSAQVEIFINVNEPLEK